MVKCDEEYTGKSAGTFEERLKKDLSAPSPNYDQTNTSGHHTKLDNFSIVGREEYTIVRTIKEAMFIRVNDPSFRRNIGKYQLSIIRDEFLFNIPGLHLKWPLLPGQSSQLHKAHNTNPPAEQETHTLYPHYQLLVGMGPVTLPFGATHLGTRYSSLHN